jgi:hypothetical protein
VTRSEELFNRFSFAVFMHNTGGSRSSLSRHTFKTKVYILFYNKAVRRLLIITMYSFMEVVPFTKQAFATKRFLTPLVICALVGASYMFGGNGIITSDNSIAERNLAPGSRSLATAYDTTATFLPSWTSTFANVWDPILSTDTPTFWYETKVSLSYCRKRQVPDLKN